MCGSLQEWGCGSSHTIDGKTALTLATSSWRQQVNATNRLHIQFDYRRINLRHQTMLPLLF